MGELVISKQNLHDDETIMKRFIFDVLNFPIGYYIDEPIISNYSYTQCSATGTLKRFGEAFPASLLHDSTPIFDALNQRNIDEPIVANLLKEAEKDGYDFDNWIVYEKTYYDKSNLIFTPPNWDCSCIIDIKIKMLESNIERDYYEKSEIAKLEIQILRYADEEKSALIDQTYIVDVLFTYIKLDKDDFQPSTADILNIELKSVISSDNVLFQYEDDQLGHIYFLKEPKNALCKSNGDDIQSYNSLSELINSNNNVSV